MAEVEAERARLSAYSKKCLRIFMRKLVASSRITLPKVEISNRVAKFDKLIDKINYWIGYIAFFTTL